MHGEGGIDDRCVYVSGVVPVLMARFELQVEWELFI